MVSETESTWQNHGVVLAVFEFVVPDKFRIELDHVFQNVNCVTVTVTARELNDGDFQVYVITLTLSE
jgi:hypothetical protein